MLTLMHRKQAGVAIVEFALVLPVLLLLIFITFEVGRAFYTYNVLTKSVRDAARYLSTQEVWTPGNWNNTANTAVQNTAVALVVWGKPNGTSADRPVVPGLAPANVGWYNGQTTAANAWQAIGTDPPTINVVTISIINYNFQPIFGAVLGVSLGNLTFGTISATMRGVR